MHSEYLCRMVLNNDLAEGRFELCTARWRRATSACRSSRLAPRPTTLRRGVRPTSSLSKDADQRRPQRAGIISEPEYANRHYRVATRSDADRHVDPETWLEQTPIKRGPGGRSGYAGSNAGPDHRRYCRRWESQTAAWRCSLMRRGRTFCRGSGKLRAFGAERTERSSWHARALGDRRRDHASRVHGPSRRKERGRAQRQLVLGSGRDGQGGLARTGGGG
jgi:hypothetical protein